MRFWNVILLSVFALIQPAYALVEVPTLRLGLALPMISFGAVDRNNLVTYPDGTPLGAMITFNPSFLWDIPQVRSRAGLHFQADIGSPYGFVTTIGVGLDFVFYPLGLSSSREVKDDDSVLIKTRMSPYIQFRITPEKFSITRTTSDSNNAQAGRDYFNVLMVETSIGAGVDYPMGDKYTLFGGLNYRFANFSSQETEVGRIGYSGISLLIGIQTSFY
jgi:hypothetical protein